MLPSDSQTSTTFHRGLVKSQSLGLVVSFLLGFLASVIVDIGYSTRERIASGFCENLPLSALGNRFSRVEPEIGSVSSNVTIEIRPSQSTAFGGFEPGEGCVEPDPETRVLDIKDPWRFTKWVGRPAKCLVQGMVIEELDPENNFRRGYALGYTAWGEDRMHFYPYLRAARDPSLSASSRRIFLDLGANHFDTSVTWFSQMYPLDFTEVHAFEAMPGLFKLPNIRSIDNAERGKRLTINITRFIKEVLKVRPEDALIVKMDIEGAEWDILPDWIADRQMAALVDEIFVEVHYHHDTLKAWNWSWPQTRSSATELYQSLRNAGFFAHPWP